MKVCSHCHKEKSESGFSKDRSRKDGLQDYCKRCNHEGYRAYRATAHGFIQIAKSAADFRRKHGIIAEVPGIGPETRLQYILDVDRNGGWLTNDYYFMTHQPI